MRSLDVVKEVLQIHPDVSPVTYIQCRISIYEIADETTFLVISTHHYSELRTIFEIWYALATRRIHRACTPNRPPCHQAARPLQLLPQPLRLDYLLDHTAYRNSRPRELEPPASNNNNRSTQTTLMLLSTHHDSELLMIFECLT